MAGLIAQLMKRFEEETEWLINLDFQDGARRLYQLKAVEKAQQSASKSGLEKSVAIAKYPLCTDEIAWLLPSDKSGISEGVHLIWTTEVPKGHLGEAVKGDPLQTTVELAALDAWSVQKLAVEDRARFLGNTGAQRSRKTQHVQALIFVGEDKTPRPVLNFKQMIEDVEAAVAKLKEGLR